MNSQKRRDLPTPGSPTTRDDLAVAGAGLLEGPAELLELGIAPDEPREPARRRGLKARARGPAPVSS